MKLLKRLTLLAAFIITINAVFGSFTKVKISKIHSSHNCIKYQQQVHVFQYQIDSLECVIEDLSINIDTPLIQTKSKLPDHVRRFFNKTYPYAAHISQEFNIPIELILAQTSLETGYGTSNYCHHRKNYFGVRINHEYRYYDDIIESFQHYARILTNSKYKTLNPQTLQEWYIALAQNHYAANGITYTAKLDIIVNKYINHYLN